MLKLPGLVRLEKLVQVKGKFLNVIIRKLNAFFHPVTDNVGHLIGEQGQPGQIGIGVLDFAGGVPVTLLFLLIGIRPVVDGTLREFVVRQRLKRCAGKVQRPLAADMVKGGVGFIGVHTFVGFIHNQDIPCDPLLVADFRQLIEVSAKVDGTLQILQADKFNAALCVLVELLYVFLTAVNKLPVLDAVHIADKDIAGLGAEKGFIILIPGVGDGRAVRDNENILCAQLHAQIIGGQGFAKAGLCVPEELSMLTAFEIIRRPLHSLRLLITELIGNHRIGVILRYYAVILGKVDEIFFGGVWLNLKPFRPVLAGNAQLLQIGVKVLIRKGAVGLRHIGGTHCPPGLVRHAYRMSLFIDTGLHIPLGKADLCPAVMGRYAWSGIGIALGDDLGGCIDPNRCHYAISFTCVSMNSISFSSKPYLR